MVAIDITKKEKAKANKTLSKAELTFFHDIIESVFINIAIPFLFYATAMKRVWK
jgi:hypothetical protein